MTFTLTVQQLQKFAEWRAGHPAVYEGAIGGRYTFRFTPTSIGDFVSVRDAVTGTELDLNDYDSF